MHSIQPRIVSIPAKKLVGKHRSMSLAENTTRELWSSFMPLRKEILNSVGTELSSVQLYDLSYFSDFDPARTFEKWAAVEVTDFDAVPEGLETFIVPAGLYAVFLHTGASATAPQTFGYIFHTWFPSSGYVLDDRPHFEVLGEKYKNNDPGSGEEIWIPVRQE